MSGNKVFLDTNIILYLLGGDKTIAELLNGKLFYISFVTQLELLGFPGLDRKQEEIINDLLSKCVILDINDDIKSRVIHLRKTKKLKLPDCIIIASSLYLNLPLITADEDFKRVDELNLILYERQISTDLFYSTYAGRVYSIESPANRNTFPVLASQLHKNLVDFSEWLERLEKVKNSKVKLTDLLKFIKLLRMKIQQ